MQDIVLIGTLLIILTAIYMIPIASLHNVPSNSKNRMMTIILPEMIILTFLHILLLQVYYFMEHSNTTEVYIAFGVIVSQIALVYSSIFNHFGLSKGEVEEKVVNNKNTTLEPCFTLMLASGIIHLTSLFIGLSILTVIN